MNNQEEKETILMLSGNKNSMIFDITTPLINVNSIEVLKTRIIQSEKTFEIERSIPFMLLSTWIPYYVAVNPDNILNIISSVSYTVNSSTTDKISYMPLKESYSLTLHNIENNTNTGLYLPYFNDECCSGQSLADMTNTWLQNVYNIETFSVSTSSLTVIILSNTSSAYYYYYSLSLPIPTTNSITKTDFTERIVSQNYTTFVNNSTITNDIITINLTVSPSLPTMTYPDCIFGYYSFFKLFGLINELPVPGSIPSYFTLTCNKNSVDIYGNSVNTGTYSFTNGIFPSGVVPDSSYDYIFSNFKIPSSSTIKITTTDKYIIPKISYNYNTDIFNQGTFYFHHVTEGTYTITNFIMNNAWNMTLFNAFLFYLPDSNVFGIGFLRESYMSSSSYYHIVCASSNLLSQLGFNSIPYNINIEPLFYMIPAANSQTVLSVTAKYPFSHVPNVSCSYLSDTDTISFNASYSFQIYPLNGYEVYGFQENYIHIAQPIYNSLTNYSIRLIHSPCLKGSNVVYIQCNEWYMNNITRDYANLFAEIYFCNPKDYIYIQQNKNIMYKRKLNNISKLSRLSLSLYSDSLLSVPYHCNGHNWYIELLITHS